MTFFRQSGWLVIATTACGVFMTLVHSIINKNGEYPLFLSLLRVFVILGIPAAGLQTVFAQQSARAVDSESQVALKGIIQAALAGTLAVWILAVCLVALFQSAIVTHLKIVNPMALWMTLLAVLPSLWLPILQGTLQGFQIFSWLGSSMIFNGLARFSSMILLVMIFHGRAASAMTAAFLGVTGSLLLAIWPTRKMLHGSKKLIWSPWLIKAVPLTVGTGAVLFVMNADVIFVQAHFTDNWVKLYGGAATVGLALVMFTTPMAAVMFPKLVRSAVTAQKSSALFNAVVGTTILGILGALACSFFPELPLSILYHGNQEFLRAAPLVRLFMWAIFPVTIANVLISNLLAREQWKVVPWLAAAAISYGFSLNYYLHSTTAAPLEAFQTIIKLLGTFSVILLAIGAVFTWRQQDKSTTLPKGIPNKL